MKLRYLVTGTGRCGTVFMARLLTNCGVSCCHEGIFDWQGIERAKQVLSGFASPYTSFASRKKWNGATSEWEEEESWLTGTIEAESSYMAAPFLKESVIASIPVIHVVRDPIKVVQSFVDHLGYFLQQEPTQNYEQFVYRHVPELKQELPPYDRAALFYVRWNEMIEQSGPFCFHRIEDDKAPLLEKLGLNGSLPSAETNSIKKSTPKFFRIDQICDRQIRTQFKEMGLRYGYKIRSEHLLM